MSWREREGEFVMMTIRKTEGVRFKRLVSRVRRSERLGFGCWAVVSIICVEMGFRRNWTIMVWENS
jgi:hypothetical protein